MEKKRILILGAGISGMSAAHFLSKSPDLEITVIEKQNRLGGWIDTDFSSGFLFENGPRTFRTSTSAELLNLADDLRLKEECIFSNPDAKGRYLWTKGKLKSLPVWSKDFFKGLVNEWRVPPKKEDETVWDFACRRFNPEVAELFFDPWVIGIYAGDIHRLSARACFPAFKRWEDTYGCLTKGFFRQKRKKGPFLFTFQRGVSSLIDALAERFSGKICLEEEVQAIEFDAEGVRVKTSKNVHAADYVFSALPCQILGKYVASELSQMRMTGTTVVNLGYAKEVLKKKGFGYLVSSFLNDEVLGCVFNSNIFPQHNMHKKEARLTVKLRRTNLLEQEAIEIALEALRNHLGIDCSPDFAKVIKIENAFPQFDIGHLERIAAFEKKVAEELPRLKVLGNFFYGAGVNDCVARARSVSESFLSARVS